MNHSIIDLSKYAKNLLLKVRLNLVSTETIKHLFNHSTFFKKDDSFLKYLSPILDCRVNCSNKSSNNYFPSRHCNQKYFKLLICGIWSKQLLTYTNVRCIDKVGDVAIRKVW